jgi:hypothetical protein
MSNAARKIRRSVVTPGKITKKQLQQMMLIKNMMEVMKNTPIVEASEEDKKIIEQLPLENKDVAQVAEALVKEETDNESN